MLQCVAVSRIRLQYVVRTRHDSCLPLTVCTIAVRCSVLQYVADICTHDTRLMFACDSVRHEFGSCLRDSTCCVAALQCVAVCCSMLRMFYAQDMTCGRL